MLFHILTFTWNVSQTKKRYILLLIYKVNYVRLWPNHIFVDDFGKNPQYKASWEAFLRGGGGVFPGGGEDSGGKGGFPAALKNEKK